ncbi:MAG: hypothetical protein F2744_09590 [Actinobacteria bacterium]|uniref:Unannotated protein n=1 Tax=freshwater metagenome TaxID=449393 RepID=A0A6J6ZQF4_9ZZZZ|nr:hypothetical protein [Actinomycetota bacterium]
MRPISVAAPVTIIEEEELRWVSDFLSELRSSDSGAFPGVQLSLYGGKREWTIATNTTTVTLHGGEGAEGLSEAVWIPSNCISYGAEAARATGVCALGIRDERSTGGVVTLELSSPSIDAMFELRAAPPVRTARWYSSAAAVGECDLQIDDLRAILRNCSRWDRWSARFQPILGQIGLNEVGIQIDLLPTEHQSLVASFRIPAATVGELSGNHTATLDLEHLRRALRHISGERVLLATTPAGRLLVIDDKHTVVAHGNAAFDAPENLADVLSPLAPKVKGSEWHMKISGATVILRQTPDVDYLMYNVTSELAQDVTLTRAVMKELNALNADLSVGRVWVDRKQRLLLGTQVRVSDLEDLPRIVVQIGKETEGLGTFIGGLS